MNDYNTFKSSQYFLNYHNNFQIITIFLSDYNTKYKLLQDFLNYQNTSKSPQYFWMITIIILFFNSWHYLYENSSEYKLHHLIRFFYCQNMRKIFWQFHKFLIYVFYFNFFSFLCLIIFLLNKTSVNLLNSIVILTLVQY